MPRVLSPSDIAAFRDRVCAVAAALLVEVGYSRFTMRELARRLGSSAMTPYRYFANKDAILDLVRLRGFSLLAEKLESALRDDDRTAAQNCRAFVGSYIGFAREESSFYKLMFDGNPGAANDVSGAEERRVVSLFVEYANLLPNRVNGNSDQIGELLWSTLHGFVVFESTGRMAGQDSEVLIDSALAAIVGASPAADSTESDCQQPAANGNWSASDNAHSAKLAQRVQDQVSSL
jgi:AcrR family transcriptional regulator